MGAIDYPPMDCQDCGAAAARPVVVCGDPVTNGDGSQWVACSDCIQKTYDAAVERLVAEHREARGRGQA